LTTAVALLTAVERPARLVAITSTRSAWRTSRAVGA